MAENRDGDGALQEETGEAHAAAATTHFPLNAPAAQFSDLDHLLSQDCQEPKQSIHIMAQSAPESARW